MLPTVLGLLLFVLFVLTALPLPGWRRAVLAWLDRLLSLVLAGAITACGVFFVRPDLSPAPLRSWVEQPIAPLVQEWPEAMQPAGLPWLIAALALVVVAVPFLLHIDFARRQMELLSAFNQCRRKLRTWMAANGKAADVTPSAMNGGHAPASEVAIALAAMKSVTNDAAPKTPISRRPRLVLDRMNPSTS